jgi:hypothetical protein
MIFCLVFSRELINLQIIVAVLFLCKRRKCIYKKNPKDARCNFVLKEND